MLFITGLQSKCKFVNIWSEYIYILSLILNINTFRRSFNVWAFSKETFPHSFWDILILPAKVLIVLHSEYMKWTLQWLLKMPPPHFIF